MLNLTWSKAKIKERPYDPYLDDDLYRPVDREATLEDLAVIGRIPSDINGVFAQIGPNPQFKVQGYNWFDGDGMIHAVRMQPDGKPSYFSRLVATKARNLERAAGKSLFTGLNQPFSLKNIRGLGQGEFMKNTANTALVPFGDEVLATWYGGAKPYRLAKKDFKTLGQQSFSGAMKRGMNAHPKLDPQTGELVYLDRAFLPSLYSKTIFHQVVRPDGESLPPVAIELLRPEAMHDFAITKNYSVIMDFPLRGMIRHGARWRDVHRSRIGILPRRYREETPKVKWFETDNNVCLHVVNAFEREDWVILIAAALENFERGQAYLYRWEMNLKTGQVRESQIDDEPMEFPRINDSYTGRPNRFTYVPMVADQPTFLFDRLRKYDCAKGQAKVVAEVKFDPDCFGSEPVFVPRSGGIDQNEDDGYVLNMLHNRRDNCAFLDIYSGDSLDLIGRVEIPSRVPVGFHCSFLPH